MSEWKDWNGGDCPVPAGTLVDVVHRDGSVYEGEEAGFAWSHAEDWRHKVDPDLAEYDIVQWRLFVGAGER